MNLLFCINGGYTGPLLDCLDSIVLHGGENTMMCTSSPPI